MHRAVEGSIVERVAQPVDDGAVRDLETLDNLIVKLLVNDQSAESCASVEYSCVKSLILLYILNLHDVF
jgi:hypothetical protein